MIFLYLNRSPIYIPVIKDFAKNLPAIFHRLVDSQDTMICDFPQIMDDCELREVASSGVIHASLITRLQQSLELVKEEYRHAFMIDKKDNSDEAHYEKISGVVINKEKSTSLNAVEVYILEEMDKYDFDNQEHSARFRSKYMRVCAELQEVYSHLSKNLEET